MGLNVSTSGFFCCFADVLSLLVVDLVDSGKFWILDSEFWIFELCVSLLVVDLVDSGKFWILDYEFLKCVVAFSG